VYLHLHDGALRKVPASLFDLKLHNMRALLLAQQQQHALFGGNDKPLIPDIERCNFVGALLEHRLNMERAVHITSWSRESESLNFERSKTLQQLRL